MTEDSGPCLIKFDAKKYKININGMIEYDAPKGRKKSIQVNLPKHFYIDAANFYNSNDGIIFIFEITDDDAGSSLITLFNKTQYILNWTVEIGAFNPSPPLSDASSII